MTRIETKPAMRLAFVTGIAKEDRSRHFPTMAEIADQFGVSLSTVTHTAAEQRWMDEREDFKRRVYESAVRQFEHEFSLIIARADLEAATAAADLIHHIRRQVEHATEQERTAMAKTLARPLSELLGVVHEAVGIGLLPEKCRGEAVA